MEQLFLSKAAKAAVLFYSLALLVWSFYELLIKNELGIPFIIMCGGMVVFMLTLIIQRRKIKKLKKD